ncbi:hypothetical protein Droror1_Dr00015706 [Drosera rotundifolia]
MNLLFLDSDHSPLQYFLRRRWSSGFDRNQETLEKFSAAAHLIFVRLLELHRSSTDSSCNEPGRGRRGLVQRWATKARGWRPNPRAGCLPLFLPPSSPPRLPSFFRFFHELL